MPESPTSADAGHETPGRSPVQPESGMPHWVKISAIVAVIVVILIVVMVLVGGGPGSHGPNRH